MKRQNPEESTKEDKNTKKQKMAHVQVQEVDVAEELGANFPELRARIESVSPALEVAVRAGNVDQVQAIIQQYNDYVDATYGDHNGYDFTPSIAICLRHLGVLANGMGFDEIADILQYEDVQELVEDSEDEYFPALIERIEGLSPALAIAVGTGDVGQVEAIIQQYDNHVNAQYSEHPAYDITPSVERVLSHLAVSAHEHGFHEICNIFEYEGCQLFGAVAEEL